MVPTHYFAIEDAGPREFQITVRSATGSPVLRSTRMRSIAHAQDSLRALLWALTQDWNYQIVNRDRAGPRFVIQLARPAATFVSRAYTSCDAMECEVAAIKSRAAALTMPPLQVYDGDTIAQKLRRHGDEAIHHAARLGALA